MEGEVGYAFENIFILMAAKNYTSNFADSPFGPDYCSSSNASLTSPSISTIIQCNFKIFQVINDFSKIIFFSFHYIIINISIFNSIIFVFSHVQTL